MRDAGEELLPSAVVVLPESRMAQRHSFAFSVSRPLPSEFAPHYLWVRSAEKAGTLEERRIKANALTTACTHGPRSSYVLLGWEEGGDSMNGGLP